LGHAGEIGRRAGEEQEKKGGSKARWAAKLLGHAGKREADGMLLAEWAGWATRRIWATAGIKEDRRIER
jgi:hypothetical protein